MPSRWTRIADRRISAVSLVMGIIVGGSIAASSFGYYNETFELGDPTAWQGTPDFKWDHPNHKLKVRSIIMGDIGDPPEIAIRRSGPDGSTPQGPPSALEPDYNIGLGMYWQAYGSHGDFDGDGHIRRNAQIYARARGEQTNYNAGGSIHLATTTVGEYAPEDVIELEHDGTIRIGKHPVVYGYDGPYTAGLKIRLPNGQVGYLVVRY